MSARQPDTAARTGGMLPPEPRAASCMPGVSVWTWRCASADRTSNPADQMPSKRVDRLRERGIVAPSNGQRCRGPGVHIHHHDLDPGAGAGRGRDRQGATDGIEALAHADQTEALAERRVDIEADTIVNDGQEECACPSFEMDLDFACVAV